MDLYIGHPMILLIKVELHLSVPIQGLISSNQYLVVYVGFIVTYLYYTTFQQIYRIFLMYSSITSLLYNKTIQESTLYRTYFPQLHEPGSVLSLKSLHIHTESSS